MSELPANWTPPTPPGPPRKSVRKPLLITLAASGVLAAITCAGGIAMANKPGGGSAGFLLLAALLLGGVFVITLGAVAVYFVIWLIEKSRQG